MLNPSLVLISSASKRTLIVMVAAILSLLGCAPHTMVVEKRSQPRQEMPSTTVYFYPTQGQSKDRQERDRYECYRWAVDQTHFDPGQAQLAPHQRITVKPAAKPGADAAAGAVGGAIVGSMMSSRHDNGFGMVFGAITGAMIGAASDNEREREARQAQRHYDKVEARKYARLEKQARNYRRAMTACLEGRGYSVR